MGELAGFKRDCRISPAHRKELRAFASELGRDIGDLADKLGVALYTGELLIGEAGYLEYAPTCGSESGFRVVVNSDDSPERQRFTIAHELAHFVLHRNESSLVARTEPMQRLEKKNWYSDKRKTAEREADRFASDLLMPSHLVRSLAGSGNFDEATLSRKFGVSREAMQSRLRHLGIDPSKVGKKSGRIACADPFNMLGWRMPRVTEQGGAAR